MEEGTGDEEYLALLSTRLSRLVDEVRPDLIFYQVILLYVFRVLGLGLVAGGGEGCVENFFEMFPCMNKWEVAT